MEKKMEENLLSSLLRGSENVDRMRREIHQVVTMILGFLVKDNYAAILQSEKGKGENFSSSFSTFSAQNIFWKLSIGCDKKYYYVNITLGYPDGSCRYTRLGDSEASSIKPIPLQHVLSVYESLPDFVDEMIFLFPKISEDMECLVEASNKF